MFVIFSAKARNTIGLEKNIKNKLNNSSVVLIVIFIGLSIIVRSIGGNAITYSWKNGLALGLIYTISMVFGKAFGGFLQIN